MGLCALREFMGKSKRGRDLLVRTNSRRVSCTSCSQPCGGAPDITTPDPIIAYRLVGIMQRIKEC